MLAVAGNTSESRPRMCQPPPGRLQRKQRKKLSNPFGSAASPSGRGYFKASRTHDGRKSTSPIRSTAASARYAPLRIIFRALH
jgi:hypothetical protein